MTHERQRRPAVAVGVLAVQDLEVLYAVEVFLAVAEQPVRHHAVLRVLVHFQRAHL